ncbi:MAG: hypothetical protein IKQ97_10470 [Eubacterium sp.]|nr:hypothetical protein [Eubacterium sp.]
MNRLKRVVVVCMMMASLMIPLSTPEFDSISGVVSTSDAASVRYTKKQAGRKLEKWWSIKNRDIISDSSTGFYCEYTKKNRKGYFFEVYTFHLNSNNEMSGIICRGSYSVNKYTGHVSVVSEY